MPTNKTQIHQLGHDDWLIYKNLRLECIKNTPWAFGSSYELEIRHEDSYWQQIISNPSRLIFGYFRDNQLIAMAGLALMDKITGYTHGVVQPIIQVIINDNLLKTSSSIVSVYCCQEYRGKGYMNELLQFIISYHWQHYGGKLSLAVEQSNQPAIKLYQKLGFRYLRDLPQRIMADGELHTELLMELVA